MRPFILSCFIALWTLGLGVGCGNTGSQGGSGDPQALGEGCTVDSECLSDSCIAYQAAKICSVACSVEADCGEDSQMECRSLGDTGKWCLPATTTCTPDCAGRACGDDGCGGTCGPGCSASESCSEAGQCVANDCTPTCAGRVCGDDGCAGTCGPGCSQDQTCSGAGQCVDDGCTPDCAARVCGDDGCGGMCGPGCSTGEACDAGACVDAPCTSDGQCEDGEFCEESTCVPDPNASLTPITDHSRGVRNPFLTDGLVVYQRDDGFDWQTRVYDISSGTDVAWPVAETFWATYPFFSEGRWLRGTRESVAVYDVRTGSQLHQSDLDCSWPGLSVCVCSSHQPGRSHALDGDSALVQRKFRCENGTRTFSRFWEWNLSTGSWDTLLEGEHDASFTPTGGGLGWDGRFILYDVASGGLHPDTAYYDTVTERTSVLGQGVLANTLHDGTVIRRVPDPSGSQYRMIFRDLRTGNETDVTPMLGPSTFATVHRDGDKLGYVRINDDGIEHGVYRALLSTGEEELLARLFSPAGQISQNEMDFLSPWAVFVAGGQIALSPF